MALNFASVLLTIKEFIMTLKDQTHLCKTEAQTKALAHDIARTLDKGTVICLRGNLGAGKSVFARAFIQYLTQTKDDIPSPTFTLVQHYETDEGIIYHLDLYRLKNTEEIYELGWEEIIDPQNIALIEWPERIETMLPKSRTEILIEITSEESRKIIVQHKK